MKVKLLISRGGPNLSQNAGEEVDVSDAEGERMIEAGQAVPVPGSKKERAVKRDVSEKAVSE